MTAGSSVPLDIEIGLQENGYKVVSLIAKGGQGEVYRAQYVGPESRGWLTAGQDVAVKAELVKDFQTREVLIQGQLHHHNILKMFDVFPYGSLVCIAAATKLTVTHAAPTM